MSDYEVWLSDERGRRLRLLENLQALEYVKGVEQEGWFGITIGGLDKLVLRRDLLVEVWRRPEGGVLGLDFVGFLRRWRYEGLDLIYLSGPGVQDLLRRRIVAYAAGSAYAQKTDYADDMMKAVVRENLGASATDTDRDLSGYGLTVAGDLSLGPEIDKGFAWKNVAEALKEMAEAAYQAGSAVYYDLIPGFDGDGLLTLNFQTFVTQRGADRTRSSGRPVFFGPAWGNLSEGEYEENYSEEATYVYAGGQGVEDARLVEEEEDTARAAASPWNRCEVFADARNETASAGVTEKALQILASGRPKKRFSARLLDTANYRYGLDWDFGDLVSCEYQGQWFDALIRVVGVSVDQEGNETISVRVEANE